MNICIVASGYPTKKGTACVFVSKLADEFAELGHNVSFIAPQSITMVLYRDGAFSPTEFVHKTRSGKVVRVYRPYIISFGGGKLGKKIYNVFLKYSLRKTLKKVSSPDVFYAHFWGPAHGIYSVIKDRGIPLFVATGESEISFRNPNDGFSEYVKGVICVSTKNKEESISKNLTRAEKCVILPNAIDDSEFFLMDKQKCRMELGIPSDAFVVGQVGTISNRKGQKRVSDALKKLNDDSIYSFFLGRPVEAIPDCKNIIRLGFTEHNMVPKYLNAADVYVFPSLAEGCSNSIVEAMSCGLPIISSDLPFNHDILDESNAILIDPRNIDQIADAIKKLKNNPSLLDSMSKASLQKASELKLNVRAVKIIEFIKSRIPKS